MTADCITMVNIKILPDYTGRGSVRQMGLGVRLINFSLIRFYPVILTVMKAGHHSFTGPKYSKGILLQVFCLREGLKLEL